MDTYGDEIFHSKCTMKNKNKIYKKRTKTENENNFIQKMEIFIAFISLMILTNSKNETTENTNLTFN